MSDTDSKLSGWISVCRGIAACQPLSAQPRPPILQKTGVPQRSQSGCWRERHRKSDGDGSAGQTWLDMTYKSRDFLTPSFCSQLAFTYQIRSSDTILVQDSRNNTCILLILFGYDLKSIDSVLPGADSD